MFQYYNDKKSLDERIEALKNRCSSKDINTDVLAFIAAMTHDNAPDYGSSLCGYYQNGLCYHFASILQHQFGGVIAFRKAASHIVWADDKSKQRQTVMPYIIHEPVTDYQSIVMPPDSLVYDSFGIVTDYYTGDILPVSLMHPVHLNGFRHVGFYSNKEMYKAQTETYRNVLEYERYYEPLSDTIRSIQTSYTAEIIKVLQALTDEDITPEKAGMLLSRADRRRSCMIHDTEGSEYA